MTADPASPELTTSSSPGCLRASQPVTAGQTLMTAGDTDADLIVVETGMVEVVRPATLRAPEDVLVRQGPGRIVGELRMLTEETVRMTVRAAEHGRVHRIAPAGFRRLMAQDPELSDLLLRTFIARREMQHSYGPAGEGIEIIGEGLSASSLALRTYAARQNIPHRWVDADDVTGTALMSAVALNFDDLPAVVALGRVLRRATPEDLGDYLGLTYRRGTGDVTDLVIVGAGPAGLAGAVYGASEGLSTILVDAIGTGGQAATSPRIENYLGFPSGITGAELTNLALVQALKFGAHVFSPCTVTRLDTGAGQLRVLLADGRDISARAVVVATGARYRSLHLPRWRDFEGAGIYYAATELEARAVVGRPVAVVGGANSAGQAALYLASRGCDVRLIIRNTDAGAAMSAYLLQRLHASPRVDLHTGSEVIGLLGSDRLTGVTVLERDTGTSADHSCMGLFCFIGADPATSWLDAVALDEDGFILTGVQLPADLGPAWDTLGRGPLPFETSVPGVFAAGDVRHGSAKRVAAAVGEGASVVRSVHQVVGTPV